MKKRILTFLLSMCLFVPVWSQTVRYLEGAVTDSVTGQSISNVVVQSIHGYSTHTRHDGTFTLRIDESDTIVLSHIGYVTAKIGIPLTQGGLYVRLVPSAGELEEVTVHTGYQTLKPNETNGSYVVLDNKALNLQTGLNILDRLTGVTSSLLYNIGKNTSGNPQSGTKLSIRGLSTINGPLDPLLVVDNFIYEGDINNINPNDVESVTVLKDAAAASIWGARAGNGVIVITTKKGGTNAKTKFSFNTDIISSGKPDLYSLPQISPADYIDFEQYLFGQGFYNSQLSSSSRPAVSPAVQVFQDRKNGKISVGDSMSLIDAMKRNDSRDQYMAYYYRRPVTQQYALQLRGGTPNMGWILSGAYDKSIGNQRTEYDRLNLRIENTYRPIRGMEISAGAYYTNAINRSGLPDYSTLISLNNTRQVPYLNLAGSGGSSIAVPHYINVNYIDTAGAGKLLDWNYYPLEEYKHNRTMVGTEDLLAHVTLNYKITGTLSAHILYQYEKQRTESNTHSDTASYYARNLINMYSQLNRTTGVVTYAVPVGGILNKSQSTMGSYNFRGQLDFDKMLSAKHRVNAIAGMEVRERWLKGNSNSYYGYNEDPLTYAQIDYVNRYPTFITGAQSTIGGSGTISNTVNRFVSYYANASYAYQDRYILSGSARKDGANVFGANTNDRWKPLWSAGLGWVMSREAFYHITWLPMLKLTATYGVSGNVDLSKTARPVGSSSTSSITGFKIEGITYINNPDLGWERAYQTNWRVEFASAAEVIRGTIEYYRKKGTGLYAPTPYDYTTTGMGGTVTANAADMKGKGLDIVLHTNNIQGKWQWSTDLLFNYNTSVTTKYYNTSSNTVSNFIGGGTIITPVVGKPLYAVAAYRWGGLDGEGNPRGYLNDTLSKDYTAIFQSSTGQDGSSSIRFIGNASPVCYGSLLNSFSYQGWSLSLNIVYKFGYYLFRPSLSYTSLANYGTNAADYSKRWLHPGDEKYTNVPSFVYPLNANRDAFYNGSEANVIKGDHIRLQFVNLGYALSFRKKSLIESLQLYANVSNLGILWRANKNGIDPDYVGNILPRQSYTIGIRSNF